MTELAYMVRDDWAQQGTAMKPSSALIREWARERKLIYAVADIKTFRAAEHSADHEAARFIGETQTPKPTVEFSDLPELAKRTDSSDLAVAALHPDGLSACGLLRQVVETGAFGQVFVMIWAREDIARIWLDSCGAANLYSGDVRPSPDPLQVEAAELMAREEHNGLSTGHGKDAVLQLIHAFKVEGFPLDEEDWLCAFFSAGGSFRGANEVRRYLREIKQGTRHRYKKRFREDIVTKLRENSAG